jgi:ferric-dicitrate binding protein FerR (iron transport regulator)
MSSEPRDRDTERLLQSAAAPKARPEFRSNLRQRFLAGAAAAPPDDVLHDELPRAARSGPARNWKPWIALACAAGVAALLWLTKPAPRHWQLLPGSHATAVRIDGTTFPSAEADLIGSALNDARSIAAEGGSLRLSYRDQYAIELPAGARVELAAFGNTGGVDPYALAAHGAAVRLVTGPGFAGHALRVQLGDASLHVTGTAFAIDDCPDGVCVCGLEGRIGVLRKGEQDAPLEAGKQCWYPKAGGPLTWGEAHEPHLAPVRELERAARERWKP